MRQLIDIWIGAQTWIFETLVSSVLFHFGLMEWFEPAFNAVEIVMLGVVQILVIALGMRFFERRWPLERWANDDFVAVDRVYTVLNKLGIIPLAVFMVTYPISNEIEHLVRAWGYAPPRLERMLPWLHDSALGSFLVYFILYDFAAYWLHRAQHRFGWWWALHSLHHDQRQMTLWSDDRNHVLDDILAAVWSGSIAMLIGVAPAEYPLVMIAFRLVESLSHTNVRARFGAIGGGLLVGPHYHRLHHDIEHARPPFARTMGCNFAVILPVWDWLFGTMRHDPEFPRTGVDALVGRPAGFAPTPAEDRTPSRTAP